MRLTDEQKAAVKETGNASVISCPGSGKTRTIVAKLLLCVDELRGGTRRVACITHTNTAADEIDVRLKRTCFGSESEYYEVSTIHSFVLRNILKPFHGYLAEIKNGFVILPSESSEYQAQAAHLIEQFGLNPRVSDDFERIHRRPDGSLFSPEHIPRELAAAWCEWLDQKAFVTFSDILFHGHRILLAAPQVASALASRFAWMLIDEFQDSASGQIAILKAIHQFNRTSFFCVGDPNQSIYRFAGASPNLLASFSNHIKANQSHVLTGNFRSSKLIVDCCEKLIPLTPAMQAVGVHKACAFRPEYHLVEHFADGVISTYIPAARAMGIELGEIAVLAPWWISLFHLAREMRMHGIPAIGPGARPYRRSHIVSGLLEAIGAFIESSDPETAQFVQRGLFYLLTQLDKQPASTVYDFNGRVALCKILAEAQNARNSSQHAGEWITSVCDAIATVTHAFELVSLESSNKIRESGNAMIKDIESRDGGATLSISDLAIFARPSKCAHLLTIHSSKGREFEAVAVIDARDGAIPHFSVNNIADPVEKQAQMEEARRVMYVASTRAKRVLMFFSDSSNVRNRPTPFLRDMGLI